MWEAMVGTERASALASMTPAQTAALVAASPSAAKPALFASMSLEQRAETMKALECSRASSRAARLNRKASQFLAKPMSEQALSFARMPTVERVELVVAMPLGNRSALLLMWKAMSDTERETALALMPAAQTAALVVEL